MEFVLGFMSAAWLLTLVGVGYTIYRLRLDRKLQDEELKRGIGRQIENLHTDILDTRQALKGTNEALIALDQRIGMMTAMARSDEEQANLERRYRARQNAGGF